MKVRQSQMDYYRKERKRQRDTDKDTEKWGD